MEQPVVSQPTTREILEQLGLSNDSAHVLESALKLLVLISVEELQEVLQRIDRCEAIGPIVDPTFFVRQPRASSNGRANKELFSTLLNLRGLLPEVGR